MTTSSPKPGSQAELEALVALAQREQQQGRFVQAAAAWRKFIALRPGIADAHNCLANVLMFQGKLDEAADQYERATALKPDLFPAHNNLGNILRRQGKLEQAVARYQKVLALRPDLAEPHNNLGNVLLSQGKLEEAAASFERALALRPDLPEPYNNLGNVRREQGKFEQAAEQYQQALALRPDYVEALNNLGNIRWEQGKFDEAAALYLQALALNPDLAEAHYHLAEMKTFRAGDVDLAALEALAATKERLPPRDMLFTHFGLGKALEDVGDYPRAFEHWLQGNALKRSQIRYDEAAWQQTFRLTAEAFDADLLNRFAGASDPSAAPIFVLGMPRSGSTLIEQILASHPQVHGAGELKNLDRVVGTLPDTAGRPVSYPEYVRWIDADGLRRLGEAYLASLPALPAGKTRLTDKMPANFFYVGLIPLILPNARIIHTVRDPVDTCLSCFSRLFASGQSYSYDLGELGRYYRWYHELMAHWRSILPAGAMLDVGYEHLVDDLERQARRMLDFCGLPWDDRCLSFYETNRPVATLSNVQIRQPVYRTSVERWRRYEPWLAPLLAELESCRPT
ncbi:MAG TPA: tetratricopeptide repeat protein [Pirellulales bacterium]|jgi:tetratricopeptide (TPR) repeat protein|nr:tetratricopeptide repeat protein [Pirellulales bacterium]